MHRRQLVHPPPARALTRLPWLTSALIISLALGTGGCELVIGGIPKTPERRATLDGSVSDEGGLDGSVREPPGGSLDAAVHTRADASAHEPDAGEQSSRDSGAGPSGAGDGPDALDASVAPDASAEPDASTDPVEPDAGTSPSEPDAGAELDAGDACTEPATWYEDQDGDTYGASAITMVSCTKPAGDWATRGGDCADQLRAVHPGVTTYSGTPYPSSGGASSFDYDCSGAEDGNPALKLAPADCSLLSVCEGGDPGYQPTGRSGSGLNAYCGSLATRSCAAALGLLCQTVTGTARDPYGCR